MFVFILQLKMPYFFFRYKPLNVVDAFKPAPHVEIDEAEDSSCAEATTRVIKALSFVVTFVIILGSAITSRMSLLLMVSQLDIPHGENMMNVVYYNRTNQSFNRSLPMRVVCSESVLGRSVSMCELKLRIEKLNSIFK